MEVFGLVCTKYEGRGAFWSKDKREKKKNNNNRASTKTLLDFPFENLLAVVGLVSLLTQQNGLV